ncbi:MAG: hypothetical protein JWN76_2956 [Chitinophagaceae bacterium]|nr:hypothetical protein [Chitinophagaceae bacterium]
MDEFKKHIQQHAGEMDFDEPRERVWENIAARSSTKKAKVVSFTAWRYAAAACILVLAVSVWFLMPGRKEELKPQPMAVVKKQIPVAPKQITATEPEKEVTALQHEKVKKEEQKIYEPRVEDRIAKADTKPKKKIKTASKEDSNSFSVDNLTNGFTQVVNMQLDKVRTLPLYGEGPQYFSAFKEQFKQLDKDELDLKKMITRDGVTAERLQDLVNILQQKITLLKELQNEISKTNSHFKQTHPAEKSETHFINI